VRDGKVETLTHALEVQAGDAMFLPAGRFHAIGGGIVLVEIQQNSDTTYRVFDWNRTDDSGKARELHVDQALRCIDFDDVQPQSIKPDGERLARCEHFEIQKWNLADAREVAPAGEFAIIGCLTGAVRCVDVDLRPGDFALIPACLQDRQLHPRANDTSLLRVTIPR
jgi:mannose-6-phosphate isomerase